MEKKMIGNRVLVLGCSGSGKSTFAKKLHQLTGLPLTHLDQVWWRADRTHISRDELDRKLDALVAGERWILDGDYSRTYEVRIRACDTVILLDYPTELCMNGILERIGTVRTDIPWVEDQPDPELVELVEKHRIETLPKLQEILTRYPEKQLIVFHSREEAEAWLSTLCAWLSPENR